jgi:hypothetical protein
MLQVGTTGINQTKPNQTKPIQAKPNQAKPSQAKPNQTKPPNQPTNPVIQYFHSMGSRFSVLM